MTARILPFPRRGPFDVVVNREGPAWLVTVRSHGWVFGDWRSAMREARWLAHNFGTSFRVVRP